MHLTKAQGLLHIGYRAKTNPPKMNAAAVICLNHCPLTSHPGRRKSMELYLKKFHSRHVNWFEGLLLEKARSPFESVRDGRFERVGKCPSCMILNRWYEVVIVLPAPEASPMSEEVRAKWQNMGEAH